ncbi:MAG: hypothetical protein AABY75_07600 [Bacteroidota bacterium]
MIQSHELSLCHRGSSPAAPMPHGMDDWVRGMRSTNATAEEWFAGESDEHGTLPDRQSPPSLEGPSDKPVGPVAPVILAA